MEQIKDIFKQVRQAKGSLAFCKEEIINDTLYALAIIKSGSSTDS